MHSSRRFFPDVNNNNFIVNFDYDIANNYATCVISIILYCKQLYHESYESLIKNLI